MIGVSFLIAFTVFFIHVTTWPSHIWEKPANWLDRNIPEWLSKPLYGCPICMTPHWGFVIHSIFWGVNWIMIVTIFAAAGINVFSVIASKAYEKMIDDE